MNWNFPKYLQLEYCLWRISSLSWRIFRDLNVGESLLCSQSDRDKPCSAIWKRNRRANTHVLFGNKVLEWMELILLGNVLFFQVLTCWKVFKLVNWGGRSYESYKMPIQGKKQQKAHWLCGLCQEISRH